MAYNLEGERLVDDVLAGFCILTEHDELDADGVFQTLLVDHDTDGEFLVADERGAVETVAVFDFNDVDVVPTLDDTFLPFGDFACDAVVVGRNEGVTIAEGVVEARVVVVELALHRVEGGDLRDGILHGLHPSFAETLGVAAVIERDDLIFEQTVDVGCVEFVLLTLVLVGTLVGKCPTGAGTITFIPPTIEHGEVDHAVHEGLFARRSGGFEGTRGGVHPDIDAADETTCELHVVVVEENDLTNELGALRDVVNLLDEALSCTVGGVRLTGKEELHGIVGIVDNLREAFEVGEEKMGALVGGETTSEADDERVGVDFVEQRHHAGRIALVAQPVVAETFADVVDEFLFQRDASFPNFLVTDLINVFPQRRIALIFEEGLAKVLFVHGFPLAGAPGGIVHAVGDVADVAFVGIHVVDLLVFVVREELMLAIRFSGEVAGPNTLEHALRNLTVQPAYAVDFLASLAEESGHAEAFALVVGILTAESHEVVPADAEFGGILAKVFSAKAFVEVVVAGRDGRVYGVKRAGADQFEGFVELETAFHEVGETLQVGKCGMSLVAVVNILLDAELLQGEDTTDTEEILLLHAVFPVAAVEGVGDAAVVFGVHLVVGVEQIEGNATDIDAPDERMYREVGERYVDYNLIAIGIQHTLDGHAVEVLRFVVGNLLSVHRKGLAEIAIAVKETDGAHIYIGVGGFLDIVAGQNAKTTGIDLDIVVHAVFHAEIGYGSALGVGLLVHVGTESLVNSIHSTDDFRIGCEFLELLVGDLVEQFNGILIYFFPNLGIQAAEQVQSFLVPAEPKIVGQLIEWLQFGGNMAFYCDRLPRRLVGVRDSNVHGWVCFIVSFKDWMFSRCHRSQIAARRFERGT